MLKRRKLLRLAALSTAAAFVPARGLVAGNLQNTDEADDDPRQAASFALCLNMATIRGHKLGFIKELQTASKAGFRSVEIWMDSLQQYLSAGGTTRDAKAVINDLGLTIENCIGFAEWIVDDEGRRTKGVEQMKREMDILAAIGCTRLAAPPMGATEGARLDLNAAAERYRHILELGTQGGVIPQLEMWGFSNNLNQVSEVAFVAMQSAHPASKLLLDVFHLYKGGSSIDSLHVVNPAAMDIFHLNDYPANIPASKITDADRVYPGDGVAPLKRLLPLLKKPAKPLVLSFEVFNAAYYKQDPLLVCQTALKKMKAVTRGN